MSYAATLFTPLAAGPDAHRKAAASIEPAPAATTPGPSAARAHILLVDDEEDLRETMRELLELYGFRIDTAVNGKDALECLQRNGPPCLIMLDLMMPVMNGWTFLTELRRLGAPYSSVPVAIVSAAADLPALGDKLNHPVFPKPTDIEALVSYVSGHCTGHH